MRKRINSIFLAMLALFAFQGNVSAQDVLYETTFNTQEAIDSWTVEGYLKDVAAFKNLRNNESMALVNNNDKISPNLETSYVVSKSITLGENNIVSFNNAVYNGTGYKSEQLFGLVVRTENAEWTELNGITYSDNWKVFVNSGDIQVPAEFNGKSVQFGFRFTSDGNENTGQIFIKDFKVTGAAAPVDPHPGLTEKALFDKSGTGLSNAISNGFSIEGYKGKDNWYTLWFFGSWYGPYGINTQNIIDGDTNIESYLVTPAIRLHVDNKFILYHTISNYAEGEAEKHLSLWIREEGSTTWEAFEGLTFGTIGEEATTELNIDPKYDDKKIQIGFKYTAEDKATAGVWQFTGIEVWGFAPDPVEAGISYDTTEFTYVVGDKDPFSVPVLNNPNGLKVKYETSNNAIAQVDEDGKVTIPGETLGDVVITAKTEECVEYLAGEASYTIHVVNPNLIFKAKFENDMCGFTEEGTSIWKFNWGNVAAMNPVTEPTTSYLVSPEIDLDANGNFVSINHSYQDISNIQEHAALCVREVGGEWKELAIENWPLGKSIWEYVNTDDILVPEEFNGKKVQFGFKFVADSKTFEANAGVESWMANTRYCINEFLVTKYLNRAEAGLSFDKAEYTYYMGETPFVSPIANNPNNLQVTYSFAGEFNSAFSIDPKTGEVTINDEGTATVVVKSEKNNEFKAGEASYKLTVKDLSIVFRHKFGMEGFGEFTTEQSNIWKSDQYGNNSAETNDTQTEGSKGYLVSPIIKLGAKENKMYWRENGYNTDFAKQAHMAVREVGGEWVEISDIDRTNKEEVMGKKLAFCNIPEQFDGKEVQIAFLFITGNPSSWGSWNIENFVLRATFIPADPALAFDKEAVKVTLGEEFTAPVLTKPEEVEVTYSSSNEEVATVDAEGVVTIVGKGETTIKAVSAEHPLYVAGEASYVLTVINPVDPELSFDQAEVLYDATTGEFVAPTLNNPNNVEVTYASSNEEVATVDAATGVVTIISDGETVITATSAASDDFLAGTASYKLTVSKFTGINSITADDFINGKVYNLQGQKVNKAAKGVYIVNGKKVVIK